LSPSPRSAAAAADALACARRPGRGAAALAALRHDDRGTAAQRWVARARHIV